MGYIYHSSAVIPEDPRDDRGNENPRESKGRPGTRAPHVGLRRNGQEISTLDLFGGNFVLLTCAGSNAWRESAESEARKSGFEIDFHGVGADGLADPSGGFAAAYGIEPSGAVLVRPDGFVAFRAKNSDGASAEQFGSLLARLRSI